MILILVFIPISIDFIFSLMNLKCPGLDTFTSCVLATNGLMNALVYGYNKEVKCLIRGVFSMRFSYTELLNQDKN